MAAIRIAPTRAQRATSLLCSINSSTSACPCHAPHPHPHPPRARALATPRDATRQKDSAFELAASNIRFGPGCTAEVGMDLANLGARRVMLVTDATVRELPPVHAAVAALEREGIAYRVFSDVQVEPKDYSIRHAIAAAQPYDPDAFLAVGGGSVIDTAKLMNLHTTFPSTALLDFVPAPLGAGLPVPGPLRPLIAVPTTAGTGSETTGTAIFDLVARAAKTGVAHRALRPVLGLCDPHNTASLPRAVRASAGLDVLCHALESYTALPYHQRVPRPANPRLRPAYQGANPISDIFALHALHSTVAHLPRSVARAGPDADDAQTHMLLAATLAGVGFGNAGVHLCHGMSYAVSSQNPARYRHAGYAGTGPLIPHGVSVAVTAPAVFRFTAAADPERHLVAAAALGVDVTRVKRESAGEVLGEALARFLVDLGDQPRGLVGLGFARGDVPALVEGTVPQSRVLALAPGLDQGGGDEEREQLTRLFEDAMEF